jgi:hypothetical protein
VRAHASRAAAATSSGGEPQDIAYLASDDARWVSGTTLVVDGAFLAS